MKEALRDLGLLALLFVLPFSNPYRRAKIKKFNSCCEEEEITPACPCTDIVPIGATSDSIIFDKNAGNSHEDYQFTIPYKCCDGSSDIVPNGVDIDGLPVTATVVTIDNELKSVTVRVSFNAAQAVAGKSGVVTYSFLVCGNKTVTKKVYVSVVDNCQDVYPVSLPLTTQQLDVNADDGSTFSFDVSLTDLACCGESTAIQIVGITAVNPSLGLTMNIPNEGDSFEGIDFSASFTFDATQAVVGTESEVRITIVLCGKKQMVKRFKFTVVDTCTPVYPSSPLTVTTVTKDINADSGEFDVAVSLPYDCCGQPDNFKLTNVAPASPPTNTGISVIAPLIGESHSGNTINFRFSFDPTTASVTAGETVNFTFRLCNNTNVVVPVNFVVTDSCADSLGTAPNTLSVTFDPDTQASVAFIATAYNNATPITFDCCDSGLDARGIRVESIASNTAGLTLTNQFATYPSGNVQMGLQWDRSNVTGNLATGFTETVNVSLDICGTTVVKPIQVTVLPYHPCGANTVIVNNSKYQTIRLGAAGRFPIMGNMYSFGSALRVYDYVGTATSIPPAPQTFLDFDSNSNSLGCYQGSSPGDPTATFPGSPSSIYAIGASGGSGGTVVYDFQGWATAAGSAVSILSGCAGMGLYFGCPNVASPCGALYPQVDFPQAFPFAGKQIRTFVVLGPLQAGATSIHWEGKVGDKFTGAFPLGTARGNYDVATLESALGATPDTTGSTGFTPGVSVSETISRTISANGTYLLVYIVMNSGNTASGYDDDLMFSATC